MQTQKQTYVTTVPPYFRATRDLVSQWCHEVTAEAGEFDDAHHHRVHEVENESRDGFIPFTSGGFEGVVYASMRNAHGSGFIPEIIKPYIDRQVKEIEAQWDEENPEHTLAWLYDSSADAQLEMFGPSREREHWREKFYELEDSSLSEGGTYFYKVYALFHNGHSWTKSESGEPEVLFCVGINTDFEYGRDNIPWLRCYGSDPQCTKWLWEKTVKAGDITAELIETITSEALEALRGA